MSIIEKITFAFKYAWVRTKLYFLGNKAIKFPKVDPVKERNADIAKNQEILQDKLAEQANPLEQDGVRRVLSDQARKQAELLWTLGNITGIQLIRSDDVDGELKYDYNNEGLRYYTLECVSKSDDDGKNTLTIEVIPHKTDPITKSMAFNSFDTPDLGVMSASIHYVRDSISTILDNCSNPTELKNDNRGTRIHKYSVEIAEKTKRGCGNFILLDTNNVQSLKDKIEDQVNSVTLENELFDDIHQDELIKYQFTLNNTIRVFSSEIFNEIAQEKGIDTDLILGYNGRSPVDGATVLTIADYFRWVKNPETHDYDTEIVYGLGTTTKGAEMAAPENYYIALKADL